MTSIKLCAKCSNPMDKNGKYCKACIKGKKYISNKKYYTNIFKQGLCFICKQPLDRCGTRCVKCNKKNNQLTKELAKKRKQNKLCQNCNNPVIDGKVYCPTCRILKNKQKHSNTQYNIINN